VTVKHLSSRTLQQIPVPLPPLAEQRRIVARIEALFARIRQARADLLRIAPLSERYHLAVLRSALRGELTADWRSTAEALEPAARLVARTPTPMQPRGGREATDEVIPGVAALSVNNPQTEPPPGWMWVPLLRLARQESGHTPSRGVAAYWNGDIPWIGIRDAAAHHGGVINDTAQHVTQAGLDNSSARLLPAQTVCLSRTASVGYVVVMGRPMATSQDFVTWTCSPALLPDFLKYALLAEGDDIRRFGKGSTHTTIYFPEIRALHICLPPLAEQREIVRILDEALPAIRTARHEATRALALLDHLERSILTRAFRGELVPQDPADEPASVSLTRSQEGAPAAPRRGRPRRAA
jgi:type I restriction enzyme S subunit